MSIFYETLSYPVARAFKKRKQRFKKDKPCAVCGRKLNPDEMMVAHKTPVSELSTSRAILDEGNWEVRCIYCERKLNHLEDLRRNREQKTNTNTNM